MPHHVTLTQCLFYSEALTLVREAGLEMLKGQRESSIGNMIRRGKSYI